MLNGQDEGPNKVLNYNQVCINVKVGKRWHMLRKKKKYIYNYQQYEIAYNFDCRLILYINFLFSYCFI